MKDTFNCMKDTFNCMKEAFNLNLIKIQLTER